MLIPAFQIYRNPEKKYFDWTLKVPEVKENKNMSFNLFRTQPYCCIPNIIGYDFHNQHPFNQPIQSLDILARNKEQT